MAVVVIDTDKIKARAFDAIIDVVRDKPLDAAAVHEEVKYAKDQYEQIEHQIKLATISEVGADHGERDKG